ncbi:MAG: glucose-1-phosphate adenylyltransferase [bacterium]|nr:glucose-1-phosphate adenylyltransferase [bacterium]
MKDVIVVILGGGRGSRLDPLTRRRSKPAVPMAGKYRLIDIPVSNAVHSGMERMYVLTQYNSVSLHRHITQTYKFDLFSRGFVQILAAQQTVSDERWFQGTADAVRRNLEIIMEAPGDLVLILSGDHMYRMDYSAMVRDHVMREADVTLGVLPCSEDEIAGFGAVRVDDTGRIVEFREKPQSADAREGMQASRALLEKQGISDDRPYLASMGIYLFRKHVLRAGLDNSLIDFGHDVIPATVDDNRIQAHLFNGYWRDIGTIRSFFDAHMDLVDPDPPFDFYDPNWMFYTHPRYLPGSRLSGCKFQHSLLAGGAIINDSEIEESVIGIRAVVNRATLRRTLIMGSEDFPPAGPAGAPPVGVGEGSVIENAIIDLNARIGKNVQIRTESRPQEADGDGWVIRDGIVVIPKNAVVPDGTVI